MDKLDLDKNLYDKIHHVTETMDHDKYRSVVLTKGYRAVVDASIYHHIKPYRWHSVVPFKSSGYVYARTGQIIRGEYVLLHNYVLSLYLHGKYDPSVKQATFNNKLTLDCRLNNLLNNFGRQAAMRNRRPKSNTTSRYKGVRKRIQNGKLKWRSQIMNGSTQFALGSFDSEEYAAMVYDAAAWVLFGASAHYNFPVGTPDARQREIATNQIQKKLFKLGEPLLNPEDLVDL